MLVARDREPPDDRAVVALGHHHRCVRIAAYGPQVPQHIADRAPLAVGGDQPRLGLGADNLGEARQLLRVLGTRGADDEVQGTTTPAPPRRGSPAAASSPRSNTSTALAPPKKTF